MPAKRQSLSLKGRALALLAQREQSVSELRRKLLRHARADDAARATAGASLGRGVGVTPPDGTPDGTPNGVADEPAPVADLHARVDEVIAWLRDHNYLSEERFVESRIHARAGRFGNLRIRQELAQHGVTLTPEATVSLKDSELERATEVWRRKFANPPADATEKSRHARFLAQRGFSPEVISRVLRSAGYAARQEDDDAADTDA
jgi:regulatory protein